MPFPLPYRVVSEGNRWPANVLSDPTLETAHAHLGDFLLHAGHRERPAAAAAASPVRGRRAAMARRRGVTSAVTVLFFVQNTAAQYDGCTTGAVENIGNGQCDAALNVPSCGYDGGDCCPCTCVSSPEHSCADSASDCLYPSCDDAPTSAEGAACVEEWHGDGLCSSDQNSAACDYDGGDVSFFNMGVIYLLAWWCSLADCTETLNDSVICDGC